MNVTPEVRRAVLLRDGLCLVVKLSLEERHVCRNVWGEEHWPDDLNQLSLEHVKRHPRMGVRAPSDEAHLVALDGLTNVNVPSRAMRAAFRAYLTVLYPSEWT